MIFFGLIPNMLLNSRRYTRFINRECANMEEKQYTAPIRSLMEYSFANFQSWDAEIEKWQESVISDE